MARKYSKKSQASVKRAMHKFKRGKLQSGKSKKAVKSRKQAVAIGLSEARAKGEKVPKAPSKKKTSRKKRSSSKTKSHATRSKTTRKKTTSRKSTKRHTKRAASRRGGFFNWF